MITRTYVSERGSSVRVRGGRVLVDFDWFEEGVCCEAAPSAAFSEDGPALLGECPCHGPFTVALRAVEAVESGGSSSAFLDAAHEGPLIPGAVAPSAPLHVLPPTPVAELIFGDDGLVRAIYNDELPPLIEGLGEAVTRRASHVEPWGGGWTADMRPSGGPILTLDGPLFEPVLRHDRPFPTRAAALAAEVAWLREHNLGEVRA